MRDLWEAYFTDAEAMRSYVETLQIAPLSPDAFVKLTGDYFASGPRQTPDYTGGGHFPHLQRPQAVADRVVRFLADLPG